MLLYITGVNCVLILRRSNISARDFNHTASLTSQNVIDYVGLMANKNINDSRSLLFAVTPT